MSNITVKAFSPFYWAYIASAVVSVDKIEEDATIFIKCKPRPHPYCGKSYIRLSFYGPRKGAKDSATFTKSQAQELGHALLSIAEGLEG